MGRYVIRRLLQFVPTAFFALFLLHYMTSVGIQLTGNPVRALFGDRRPPQSVLDQLTANLGLDDPCLQRPFDPCVTLFGDRLTGYFTGLSAGDPDDAEVLALFGAGSFIPTEAANYDSIELIGRRLGLVS